MVVFVPLDLTLHKDEFIQLNYETMDWHFKQFTEHYQIEVEPRLGKTARQIAESSIETYRDLKPPKGIFYLLQVDDEIAGMGALRKLDNGIGELKRMWNRTQYRGRGFGKLMVKKLLEKGDEISCEGYGLSTPRFTFAAHHVYESFGFEVVESIDEIEVADWVVPYYILMKKNP